MFRALARTTPRRWRVCRSAQGASEVQNLYAPSKLLLHVDSKGWIYTQGNFFAYDAIAAWQTLGVQRHASFTFVSDSQYRDLSSCRAMKKEPTSFLFHMHIVLNDSLWWTRMNWMHAAWERAGSALRKTDMMPTQQIAALTRNMSRFWDEV